MSRTTIDNLNKLARKAAGLYGLSYHALFINENGCPTVDHSYPTDWVQLYLNQEYHRFDKALSCTNNPILWDTSERSSTSPDEQRMYEQASDHGISVGYTVPLIIKGSFAHLTFSDGGSHTIARRKVDRLKYYYQSFAQALSCISHLEDTALAFGSAKLDLLLATHKSDIDQSRKRNIILRSAIVSATHSARNLPDELKAEVEQMLDIAYSTLD